jgi:hypothetical protein
MLCSCSRKHSALSLSSGLCLCFFLFFWGGGGGGGGALRPAFYFSCSLLASEEAACHTHHAGPTISIAAVFQIEYPEIEEGSKPRHRVMSSYEQRKEPWSKDWQYLLFAAEPYVRPPGCCRELERDQSFCLSSPGLLRKNAGLCLFLHFFFSSRRSLPSRSPAWRWRSTRRSCSRTGGAGGLALLGRDRACIRAKNTPPLPGSGPWQRGGRWPVALVFACIVTVC